MTSHKVAQKNWARRSTDNDGLSKIIGGLSNFFDKNSQINITEGIIIELCQQLEISPDHTLIARRGTISDNRENRIRVAGAAGCNASYINHSIQRLSDEAMITALNHAFRDEQDIVESEYSVIFTSYKQVRLALYVPVEIVMGSADFLYLKELIDGVAKAQINADKLNELYAQAYQDSLTQLPNRYDFIRFLNQPDYANAPFGITVALIDIQHFSDVNDSLGQEVGNALLKAIAKRLSSRCDDSCKVARVGADIFGIIGSSATLSASFIDSVFEAPFRASNYTLNVNVASGLCILEGEIDNGIDILKRCNLALNEAKRSFPTKSVWYNQELEIATVWRLELTRKLTSAFELRQLEVWYQPKFILADRSVYGFEALLRWQQPDGSYINPDTFIPLAEYSGLITELGMWVLEESIKQLQQLQSQHFTHTQIAVNVSMIQLKQRSFVHRVKQLLEQYTIDATQLELEVTESVLMQEPEYTINTLNQLKELGVSIAIDDFGTGFSSLQYLQKMPIDRLKIDREFIKEPNREKSTIVTEMIIQLAQKFGMSTVAEGIEQEQQIEYLQSLGCHEGQGFLLAQPVKSFAMRSFLQS